MNVLRGYGPNFNHHRVSAIQCAGQVFMLVASTTAKLNAKLGGLLLGEGVVTTRRMLASALYENGNELEQT